MHLLDISSYLPIVDPTWIFFVVLAIILAAPLLLGRLHIPHIIGMIFAGILIGPHGLHILDRDSSFELFGKVGLYYIMFLASLEMDMQDMKRNQKQALVLGLAAFIFPLAMGVVSNMFLLEYGLAASILLASMYASHTLIAYPIVIRYGVSRERSVSIAVGGTIVTDTLTLLVLAVISGMYKGDSVGWDWMLLLLVKVIALTAVICYTFPRIGRWFFRKYNDGVVQFVFVLGMVFLGAGLMEMVGMEGILGAFLVGIVLNRLIPHSSPLMTQLEFVGNALFIPYFLIGVGMLIDVNILFGGGDSLKVAAVMIVMALLGKWVAAWVTQKSFGMSALERELMYGLSNAQAAATLAAVLVGYEIILPDGSRLLNEDVLNGTVVLILVTCIVSSFITEYTARKTALTSRTTFKEMEPQGESTLIALSYPESVEPIVNLALMMRNRAATTPLMAMNVVLDDDHVARERGQKLLAHATRIASAANVKMKAKVRLATNLANGIIHAMKENDYAQVVVGLHIQTSPHESFFGPVLLSLLSDLNRQIMMVRSTMPINTIRRIHVAIPANAEYEAGFQHWVKRIARIGRGLGCRVCYHGHPNTLQRLREFMERRYATVRAEYDETDGGNELKRLSTIIEPDHLLVVICARRGSISFRPSLDHVPHQIRKYYMKNSLLIIFPDGYDAQPAHSVNSVEPQSILRPYEADKEWFGRWHKKED